MVAREFIELFNKFSYNNRVSVEDYADRMSMFTVVIFLLFCIIVTAKQYFMNSISCYIPVKPSGDNYNSFLTDYCWVHGTIPLRPDEPVPDTPAEWRQYDTFRRINYYQWVPFVLGLQCLFFYLPHVLWQLLSHSRAGGDLFALVKTASDSATMERSSRKNQVRRVSEFLQDMIAGQREIRHGRIRTFISRTYQSFGLCIFGKRIGNCLTSCYFLFKTFKIGNALLQIWIIQQFLGFHPNGTAGQSSAYLASQANSSIIPMERPDHYLFGISLLRFLITGREWPSTLLFPRVAFCRVPGVRIVGSVNTYTAQCTLPINMLNEKLYTFLWFWIFLLILTSLISLITWLYRLFNASHRKNFVKRFLRIRGVKSILATQGILLENEITASEVDDFVNYYLRRDGVFLVKMLAMNAGEVFTSEVVEALYLSYQQGTGKYSASSKSSDIGGHGQLLAFEALCNGGARGKKSTTDGGSRPQLPPAFV